MYIYNDYNVLISMFNLLSEGEKVNCYRAPPQVAASEADDLDVEARQLLVF